ncbi:uncharacterized protein [Hyperolius riggenbachi]|uniref:uncharacterized protein isoform X2 n=1 Tax=Hyperolius riggenbachi TaxID=752182 RepID=UPI0035A2B468
MAGRRASTRSCRASAMSKEEMITMICILDNKDYDGRQAIYHRPNVRKDKIMAKVIRVLRKTHGTKRQKKQLRQRWSDLKNREYDVLTKLRKKIRRRARKEERQRCQELQEGQSGPSGEDPEEEGVDTERMRDSSSDQEEEEVGRSPVNAEVPEEDAPQNYHWEERQRCWEERQTWQELQEGWSEPSEGDIEEEGADTDHQERRGDSSPHQEWEVSQLPGRAEEAEEDAPQSYLSRSAHALVDQVEGVRRVLGILRSSIVATLDEAEANLEQLLEDAKKCF